MRRLSNIRAPKHLLRAVMRGSAPEHLEHEPPPPDPEGSPVCEVLHRLGFGSSVRDVESTFHRMALDAARRWIRDGKVISTAVPAMTYYARALALHWAADSQPEMQAFAFFQRCSIVTAALHQAGLQPEMNLTAFASEDAAWIPYMLHVALSLRNFTLPSKPGTTGELVEHYSLREAWREFREIQGYALHVARLAMYLDKFATDLGQDRSTSFANERDARDALTTNEIPMLMNALDNPASIKTFQIDNHMYGIVARWSVIGDKMACFVLSREPNMALERVQMLSHAYTADLSTRYLKVWKDTGIAKLFENRIVEYADQGGGAS